MEGFPLPYYEEERGGRGEKLKGEEEWGEGWGAFRYLIGGSNLFLRSHQKEREGWKGGGG